MTYGTLMMETILSEILTRLFMLSRLMATMMTQEATPGTPTEAKSLVMALLWIPPMMLLRITPPPTSRIRIGMPHSQSTKALKCYRLPVWCLLLSSHMAGFQPQ